MSHTNEALSDVDFQLCQRATVPYLYLDSFTLDSNVEINVSQKNVIVLRDNVKMIT